MARVLRRPSKIDTRSTARTARRGRREFGKRRRRSGEMTREKERSGLTDGCFFLISSLSTSSSSSPTRYVSRSYLQQSEAKLK